MSSSNTQQTITKCLDVQIEQKLRKRCRCSQRCVELFNKYVLGDSERYKQFESIFRCLTQGTNIERADHNYVLDPAPQHEWLKDWLLHHEPAPLSGGLFAFNNFLTKRVLPALKMKVLPSAMVLQKRSVPTVIADVNMEQFFQERPLMKQFHAFFSHMKSSFCLVSSPVDGSIWLPTSLSKQDIFDLFQEDCYSLRHFFDLWEKHYPDIKLQKTTMRWRVTPSSRWSPRQRVRVKKQKAFKCVSHIIVSSMLEENIMKLASTTVPGAQAFYCTVTAVISLDCLGKPFRQSILLTFLMDRSRDNHMATITWSTQWAVQSCLESPSNALKGRWTNMVFMRES